MKNLYKILGINKDATSEEVKKAYFAMAKKYHPDSADKSELEKFHEVTRAYKILSNTEERRAYDLSLDDGKKIPKPAEEKEPPHPTIFKREPSPDEAFRLKEKDRFRRAMFWKAVFRVIGFSLILSAVGLVVSLLLDGIWFLGLIAGFLAGLPFSVYQNFDLKSFIRSRPRRRAVRIFGWVLFILGVGYFVWMVAGKFV